MSRGLYYTHANMQYLHFSTNSLTCTLERFDVIDGDIRLANRN